jgi:hypothetical protein
MACLVTIPPPTLRVSVLLVPSPLLPLLLLLLQRWPSLNPQDLEFAKSRPFMALMEVVALKLSLFAFASGCFYCGYLKRREWFKFHPNCFSPRSFQGFLIKILSFLIFSMLCWPSNWYNGIAVSRLIFYNLMSLKETWKIDTLLFLFCCCEWYLFIAALKEYVRELFQHLCILHANLEYLKEATINGLDWPLNQHFHLRL